MVVIPGYRVVRELGRGGMAVVYLAEQRSLQREVALKLLLPEVSGDPALRRRFLREARIAASLHHRHIVAVHDVGEHRGRAYLAMEYLPLGPVSRRAGSMSAHDALRCVLEIADALDHAHAHGVVHRDIKPENILCHEDGGYMLADFGIAHAASASTVLTRQGQTAGTPAYMAPELWRDGAASPASDFYALGVVLYALLTAELPFRGADGWAMGMQHMNAPLPPLPPPLTALQGLLARLMERDPSRRLASGTALRRHVEALVAEGAVAVPMSTSADTDRMPAASPTSREARLLQEWPFVEGDGASPPTRAAAAQDAGVAPDARSDLGVRSPASARPLERRASERGLRGWMRHAAAPALLLALALLLVAAWPRGGGEAAAKLARAQQDYLHGLHLLERANSGTALREVVARFEAARETAPGFAHAEVGVCLAELRRHEIERDADALDAAEAACARARSLDASLPELVLAQAHLARNLGDGASAARGYAEALEHPVTRTEARIGLARVAAREGRVAEALAELDRARDEDPASWRIALTRGNLLLGAGRLDAAAESFDEAARLAPPGIASPWTNLGATHMARMDFERASAALTRSVAAEPTASALNNLGLVRFYLGDYAEAAALLRRAVALSPGDHRIWGNLGDALTEVAGASAEARQSYGRAADEAVRLLAASPEQPRLRANLAWYLANLGEHERARAELAIALSSGRPADVALLAAQVHARLGELDAADEALDEARAASVPEREIESIPVLAQVLAKSRTSQASGQVRALAHQQGEGPEPRR